MNHRQLSSIFAVLLFFLGGRSYAADILTKPEPFTLTLEPVFGVTAGSVDEYVYDNGYMLSRLIWDLKPLFYAGMSASVTVFGADISASLTLGLPGYSGVMEDFDYMNYDSAVTHYSISAAKILSWLQTGVSLGYRLNLLDRFTLTPFWEFRYRLVRWGAYDGYVQYPPEREAPYTEWSQEGDKQFLTGCVITYRQEYLFTGFGISASARISRRFSASLLFRFSPLVWCTALDDHILRRTEFLDVMSGGYTLGGEIGVLFSLTERNALRLGCGYEYTGKLRGRSYSRQTGTVSSEYSSLATNGGTESSLFSVTLSMTSRILSL